ncbi:protein ANTAGONIST OF LIKE HETEROCHROMATIN PROTEIN 1-like isoform X1 [Sceloporus undulatus]|uniref:protein ANTAGONIST OF LIKE HETEROCHROMATIN PROTEIN 1-like isoform X1 n=2 Tax=Sceloporus undulatus TaxID=8520 RepID=UPI001C4D8582|nr:protein ANTAGONIST OF LIKE HETEROCHROMATIN PROTEIN 1-like isoform X1 [Sceloporus undulatus]
MYLAHKGSCATVATFFGVGKSTAYRAIIHVFLCMETHLLRRAVYLGDHRKVMAGFERLGFPQVVGAIDGCHIPIIAPAHEGAQYINRKQTHSMILQATCDHNGIFLDLFTGFAGSNHDTFLLKESPIYHALKAGIYVPGRPTVTIAGKRVGPILLGDGGYPIKPFLLIPFKVGHSKREGVYNRRLSKARCIVERSFGRLKSRFRALQCGLDLTVDNLPSAILAGGILHNIIETNGEVLNGRNTSPESFVIDPRRYISDDDERKLGEGIRDAFVTYFNS